MYNPPSLCISTLCLLFEVTPLCSRIQVLGCEGSAPKPKSRRPKAQLEWNLPTGVSGGAVSCISWVGCRDFRWIHLCFLQTGTGWSRWMILGHTAENTFHLDVRFLTDPSLGSALLHSEGDLKESSLIIRLIPLLKQLQWFLTITMPNLPSEHKWY